MQTNMVLALGTCLSLLAAGCNPKMGIVLLDTNPQQATVYLSGKRIGETPVQFELDMRQPVNLRIMKEGYESVTEYLNVDWVRQEYEQGHYKKGDYTIKGKMQAGFEVETKRDLKRR